MSSIKYFIEQNIRKLTIDEFLNRELNAAGYGGVEIRKMPMRTEVVIQASRPGVVIGRRGVKIRELTYILENEFGVENVQVEVAEIENPWLNAQVMASRLARQLERGVRFRRMAYWILRRVMRAGAIGCEIIVKGKLSSRRARSQVFRQGTIAKTGEPVNIFVDESDDKAILKPGIIGIKVRIMRPEAKLPGIVTIKKPKIKKTRVQAVVKKSEIEESTDEDETDVDEGFEGITDIDELRELEELDGLELVDDESLEIEDEPIKPSSEVTKPEPSSDSEESPIVTDDSTLEDLKELDELDSLDEGGD